MENLLEDEAYKKMKWDPMNKWKRGSLHTTLKEYKEKGYITTKQRMHLTHQFSQLQIYMACQRYIKKRSPSDLL